MPFLCAGVEWKKIKTLGKGSFGEAHLITAVKDPQRQAVVKLVNLSSMSSNERRDANNEVIVLSKLRHPNIVGFIGSFEADGYLNIVMEYCNAGDVEALVKKQGSKLLPEETVASLFIQTAHALRYMHAKKIMHRDLKSQNIFLHRKSAETPYIAKLGDFGISTMLKNTLAMAKTVCGTPYYFSPELCLNRPYNNKSDIWSLGIILYELAALKHAFDASSMKGLMQRILQGKYDAVPKVYHKSLGELLQNMLHQKVDRRFDIGRVLSSDFVKQHSERMQIAHDLSKTQRMGGDELLGKGGGGDANKVVDPRFMTPLTNAQNGIANAGKGKDYDDRDSRAMLNRLAADKDRDQKKMVLEDQRRRRRIEAARNYDRHREGRALQVQRLETDRLDDIRRRVEICSWEDQQKYIDEGWKFVQETKQKQDQRQRHQFDTDRQLMDVRSQMEAIEAKMKERRAARGLPPSSDNHSMSPPLPKEGGRGGAYAFVNPPTPQSKQYREPTAAELAKQYRQRISKDAPWNRNREFPIGFTKETWEAYQNANPNDKGGIAVDGNQLPVPRPKEPLDLKKLKMLGTARVLTDYDIDALLEEEEGTVADELMKYDPIHKARMDNILLEKAKLHGAQEWELHKRRIEQAKRNNGGVADNVTLPSSSSSPTTVRQYLPLEARICVESDGDDASYDEDEEDDEQVLTSTTVESGETDDDDESDEEEEEGFSGPDDHLPQEERRRPSVPTSCPTRDDAPLNVIYRSRDQPEQPQKPQVLPKTKHTTNKSKPHTSKSTKSNHHHSNNHNGDAGYSSGVFDETFEEVISAMRQQEGMPPLPETFGDDGWDNSNEEEEMMFRKMYGLPPAPSTLDDAPPQPHPQKPSSPQSPTSKRPASGSPGRVTQHQAPLSQPSRPEEVVHCDTGDDDFQPQTSQITEDTITQFTLDGRPLLLPGVTPNSSLKSKTDALQNYLVEALGGKRSFKKLYESLVSIQGAEVGEEDANTMVVNLERQYGDRKVFVDLMMQLMVCEGVLQQQQQQ